MKGLRLLASGEWSHDPHLVAGREALFAKLRSAYSQRSLGELAAFTNGRAYDRDLLADEGVPIIRIGNMSDPDKSYLYTTEEYPSKWHVAPGQLLASWSASFRTVIWAGPEGMLNQHIFKVEENDGVDRAYLRHAIESSFHEMMLSAVGIGMMHLRRRDFLGHMVPVPPKETQVRVAALLDWLEGGSIGVRPRLAIEFADIEKALDSTLGVIAKCEQLRRARRRPTRTLLGQRVVIGQEGRVLFTAALAKLELYCAGSLCQLVDVLADRPRAGPSFSVVEEGGGAPVVMPSATTGFRFDEAQVRFSPKSETLLPAHMLEPGDILFPRGNKPDQVGNSGVYRGVPEGASYANLLMRLRFRPGTDPDFANFWLMTRAARAHVRANTKGTSPSVQKINSRGVLSIPFPMGVSLDSQKRWSAALRQIRVKCDELEGRLIAQNSDIERIVPALLARVASPSS